MLRGPRICAPPLSPLYRVQVWGGAAEILAPPKLSRRVGDSAKNLCLICAICALRSQNLCFIPFGAIQDTNVGGLQNSKNSNKYSLKYTGTVESFIVNFRSNKQYIPRFFIPLPCPFLPHPSCDLKSPSI